jgi:hypothetical protein
LLAAFEFRISAHPNGGSLVTLHLLPVRMEGRREPPCRVVASTGRANRRAKGLVVGESRRIHDARETTLVTDTVEKRF